MKLVKIRRFLAVYGAFGFLFMYEKNDLKDFILYKKSNL